MYEFSAVKGQILGLTKSGDVKRIKTDDNGNLNVNLTGNAYDELNDMIKIQSMQKKFRDSFVGSSLDANKWDILSNGTNQTISVSSGTLTLASGTTANASSSIATKDYFTIPCRAMVGFQLSQRIANQDFYLDMVSCDPTTGAIDDLYMASWKLNGTTATQGIYRVVNGGITPLDSAASTINTTASYNILEIELFADETWFHSRQMDSPTGRNNSYVRHQQIPDPNRVYKFRIRVVNGGTAPASNTNLLVQYLTVIDYSELTTEITASRGASVAGMGMPVSVANTVSLSANSSMNLAQIGGQTPSVLGNGILNISLIGGGTTNGCTNYKLLSAATANATSLKTSAGRIYMLDIYNASASTKYVKFFNKATAPLTSDVPVQVYAIPAGQTKHIHNPLGIYFATGIAFNIVGGIADNDATAVVANDVVLNIIYA